MSPQFSEPLSQVLLKPPIVKHLRGVLPSCHTPGFAFSPPLLDLQTLHSCIRMNARLASPRTASRMLSTTRPMQSVPLLVSPQEAHAILQLPSSVALDATWHMPNSGRDAVSEFSSKRIPEPGSGIRTS